MTDHGTRHLTPADVKTLHLGNPHTPSKQVKQRRELKRLKKKFGENSFQVQWFLRGRTM